jgi:hypothetical protein
MKEVVSTQIIKKTSYWLTPFAFAVISCGTATVTAAAQPDGNPFSPAARAAAQLALHQQAKARNAAFLAEPADAEWSKAAAAALRHALDAPEAKLLTLRALECRSKTCRVEIVPDGNADLNDVLPRVLMHAANALTALIADPVQQDGADAARVFYFSR